MRSKHTMALCLGLVILLAVSIPMAAAKKAYELIDWNKPIPMTERLLADEYVLPEGWKEATKGVKELVFFNSGGLKDDAATAIGMHLFEQRTGIKMRALEVGAAYTFPKLLSVLTSKDSKVHFGFARTEIEYTQVAAAGWVHPINELWTPEVRKLYSPGLMKALNYQGNYYGGVNIVQWYVFYYRPSWLKAAGVDTLPENWTDIYAAAKKARAWAKKNKSPDSYGFTFAASKAGHIHLAFLSSLTYSQGSTLLKDGKWNLDTPEFRNSFKYLIDMMQDDTADPACVGFGWKDYHNAFGMGKAAMTLAYSVYAVKFDQEYPEIKGDWVAKAPPKWDASQPESNRIGYINYDAYVINKAAKDNYKAAAMLWFDFYRSKEACTYELLVEGNDAMLPAVYEDPNIKDKVDWDMARAVSKKVGAKPPIEKGTSIADVRAAASKTASLEALPPGGVMVSNILAEYLGVAIQKNMDPDKAFDMAMDKIKKYTSY
jgi:ABC-type glycerol-3-phosphate transport system substrate-binding protein